jgi:hypothetical protein
VSHLEHPDGSDQERRRERAPEQVDARVALGHIAQHPRHDPPAVERRRFARMVAPVPAPPATYANASADIALRARSSSMVASVGTRGRRPLTPAA